MFKVKRRLQIQSEVTEPLVTHQKGVLGNTMDSFYLIGNGNGDYEMELRKHVPRMQNSGPTE